MVLSTLDYVSFRWRVQTAEEAGQQRQRQLRHGLPTGPVYSVRGARFQGGYSLLTTTVTQDAKPTDSSVKPAHVVRGTGVRAREWPQRALNPGRLKSRSEGEKVVMIPNTFPGPYGTAGGRSLEKSVDKEMGA